MSTVTIITAIIVVLAFLVCYAVVSQSIRNKQEQKKRVLAALSSQARTLKFILQGCPKGFLPKELKLLLLKNLVEVCEQLTLLAPEQQGYKQDLQTFSTQQRETLAEASAASSTAPLKSTQLIKNVKVSLEELNRYIHLLESKAQIKAAEAQTYKGQIKQLVLNLAVDGYMLNGDAARQAGKTKLAHHSFDLALNLLIREGKPGLYEGKIAKLKEISAELASQLESESTYKSANAGQSGQDLESEWSEFEEESAESVWKKRQIYD